MPRKRKQPEVACIVSVSRVLSLPLSLFAHSDKVRYLSGSVLCGTINVAVMVVGDQMGAGYVPLSFASYAASGTVGYFYHASVTFYRPFSLLDYTRFFAGLLLGLPIWLLSMALLRDGFQLSMWVAAPTVTTLMLVYHFLSAKLAILWRLRG